MFTYIQTGNEAKQNSKVFVESNPLAARVGRWDDHVAPPQISSNNPSASSGPYTRPDLFRRAQPPSASSPCWRRWRDREPPWAIPAPNCPHHRTGRGKSACRRLSRHLPRPGRRLRLPHGRIEETVGIDSVDRGHFNLRPSQQPVAEAKADRSAQSRKDDPIRP